MKWLLLFVSLLCVAGCTRKPESWFFIDLLGADRDVAISAFGEPMRTTPLTGNGELIYWETDTLVVQSQLREGIVKRLVFLPKDPARAPSVLDDLKVAFSASRHWTNGRRSVLGEDRDVLIRDDSRITMFEHKGGIYVYGENLDF